jgi:hypothetical protein
MAEVNVSFRVLKDTGHEFGKPEMAIVGEWLRDGATRKPSRSD